MTGIVDVGGGLRGIYGAGIFDYCMDEGIEFDYGIGVSAGSANLCSYLAGQRGRNYRFYTEYSFRKEYMSVRNLLRTGSYVDMDYIYGRLSNEGGEDPLDYEKIRQSRTQLRVVAADAVTGKPVYFDKTDLAKNNYNIMKASCCIPMICKPYRIKGVPYYDGAIVDPIPVQKALDDGCDRVVVILTRPLDTIREGKKDAFPSKVIAKKYPEAGKRLSVRYKTYNDQIALAKKYQEEGKALIIAPDDCCGMSTLTKDRKAIDALYRKGYRDAERIRPFLES